METILSREDLVIFNSKKSIFVKIKNVLASVLTTIYPLSAESINLIQSIAAFIELPKGHLLMQDNHIEKYLYIIQKGIVRAYSDTMNQEVTFWFGLENDVIISMKSYVNQEVSYEKIELLEDCQLYQLNLKDLQQLYETNLEISNWGRKLAELELLKLEERFIARQFKSAGDRYQDLLENHSHLLQRIQLGYIASYLGITQVSLSRIRSEVK